MKSLSHLDLVVAGLLSGGALAALFAFPWIERVECLRSGPATLRWLTIAGEASILAAYTWIPARLVATWLRLRVRPEAMLLGLFGAFLLWAVLSYRSLRTRDRAAGRRPPVAQPVPTLIAVAVGAVLWFVFARWLHAWLIGIQPFA